MLAAAWMITIGLCVVAARIWPHAPVWCTALFVLCVYMILLSSVDGQVI
jgi:hypothetical protein